jgi:hypothetical protein
MSFNSRSTPIFGRKPDAPAKLQVTNGQYSWVPSNGGLDFRPRPDLTIVNRVNANPQSASVQDIIAARRQLENAQLHARLGRQ